MRLDLLTGIDLDQAEIWQSLVFFRDRAVALGFGFVHLNMV